VYFSKGLLQQFSFTIAVVVSRPKCGYGAKHFR